MKFIVEDDKGKQRELGELSEIVGSGDIVIKLNTLLRANDLATMRKDLQKQFNRNVILLDARVEKIYVLP